MSTDLNSFHHNNHNNTMTSISNTSSTINNDISPENNNITSSTNPSLNIKPTPMNNPDDPLSSFSLSHGNPNNPSNSNNPSLDPHNNSIHVSHSHLSNPVSSLNTVIPPVASASSGQINQSLNYFNQNYNPNNSNGNSSIPTSSTLTTIATTTPSILPGQGQTHSGAGTGTGIGTGSLPLTGSGGVGIGIGMGMGTGMALGSVSGPGPGHTGGPTGGLTGAGSGSTGSFISSTPSTSHNNINMNTNMIPDNSYINSNTAPSTNNGNNNNMITVGNIGSLNSRSVHDRLVCKLTADLMKTYNDINKKYYLRKQARTQHEEDHLRAKRQELIKQGIALHNDGHDDKDYNYIIIEGEKFGNGRYIIEHTIGKGSFGRVVKAFDKKLQKYVALKIVKSKPAFYKQAQIEIEILSSLQADADNSNIVQMIDTFMHKGHQCISFELLSLNLYELLKNTRFVGVSLKLVAKFAIQLLHTLHFLSKSERADQQIIHCDLKPENILLRNPRRSQIKVIDFGSSCFANFRPYTYIQSRFYRAPEILLNLTYSPAIDVWSLGCILVELHTGRPLFDGTDESDQMIKIVSIMGMPPDSMLFGNKKAEKFFEFDQVNKTFKVKPSLSHKLKNSNLKAALADRFIDNDIYRHFLDFVGQMLIYNPNERIRPAAAISHAFMQEIAQQASINQNPITVPTDSNQHAGASLNNNSNNNNSMSIEVSTKNIQANVDSGTQSNNHSNSTTNLNLSSQSATTTNATNKMSTNEINSSQTAHVQLPTRPHSNPNPPSHYADVSINSSSSGNVSNASINIVTDSLSSNPSTAMNLSSPRPTPPPFPQNSNNNNLNLLNNSANQVNMNIDESVRNNSNNNDQNSVFHSGAVNTALTNSLNTGTLLNEAALNSSQSMVAAPLIIIPSSNPQTNSNNFQSCPNSHGVDSALEQAVRRMLQRPSNTNSANPVNLVNSSTVHPSAVIDANCNNHSSSAYSLAQLQAQAHALAQLTSNNNNCVVSVNSLTPIRRDSSSGINSTTTNSLSNSSQNSPGPPESPLNKLNSNSRSHEAPCHNMLNGPPLSNNFSPFSDQVTSCSHSNSNNYIHSTHRIRSESLDTILANTSNNNIENRLSLASELIRSPRIQNVQSNSSNTMQNDESFHNNLISHQIPGVFGSSMNTSTSMALGPFDVSPLALSKSINNINLINSYPNHPQSTHEENNYIPSVSSSFGNESLYHSVQQVSYVHESSTATASNSASGPGSGSGLGLGPGSGPGLSPKRSRKSNTITQHHDPSTNVNPLNLNSSSLST